MSEAVSALALSLVANPGAYVFVVGSGLSRAAGIPTGWEIVERLIQRLAAAEGEPRQEDPAGWFAAKKGSVPSYTTLVESLAPRAAERAGLLAGFFEATDEDRRLGLKQPTRAHRAIAELVHLGVVRIIVTTNFDRLMEAAVRERGIEPTVVSSDDDLAGVPPLTLIRCLVIKAHGDYLDTRIRNTPDEVASLDPEISAYLGRIVQEYGLLIAGWSADYDAGLRGVFCASAAGRYAAHWTSRSDLSGEAAQLAADLRANIIRIRDADSFFAALVEAVKSVQSLLRHGPLGEEVAVATAKRLMGSSEGTIPLSDLLMTSVERARTTAQDSRPTVVTSPEHFAEWLETLKNESRELIRLYATIGYWGGADHANILLRGLERLTQWGLEGGIVVILKSRMYPSLLALYAAGIASVAAQNFPMLARLLRARLPHSESRNPGDDDTLPASQVLNAAAVLDHGATDGVLNLGVARPSKHYTPHSVLTFREVRPFVGDLIPGDVEFERAFDTFEALLAARYVVDGGRGVPTGEYAYRGHRIMMGRGVPERLQDALRREGSIWPPVVAGVFDDVDQAERALSSLIERLAGYNFDW